MARRISGETPFVYVIESFAALIIGNDLLSRIFRANKAAIEIGYREQFFVANGEEDFR